MPPKSVLSVTELCLNSAAVYTAGALTLERRSDDPGDESQGERLMLEIFDFLALITVLYQIPSRK